MTLIREELETHHIASEELPWVPFTALTNEVSLNNKTSIERYAGYCAERDITRFPS